jgi:hypothetical protein
MPTKKSTTQKPRNATKSAPTAATAKSSNSRSKTSGRASSTKKNTPSRSRQEYRALPAAVGHEAFWMRDGTVLHTVADLAEALRHIDQHTYEYHVTTAKNDFAQWVEVVLGEERCAADLRKAKTPRSARNASLKCLRSYET